MRMKLRLIMAIFALLGLTVAVGCSNDDTELTSQRADIVRFLTTTHVPILVAEEDVANSLEVNLPPSGSGCLSPEGEGLQPAISVQSFVLCAGLVVLG